MMQKKIIELLVDKDLSLQKLTEQLEKLEPDIFTSDCFSDPAQAEADFGDHSKSPNKLAAFITRIGEIHFSRKNYQSALHFLQYAIDNFRSSLSYPVKTNVLDKLSLIYKHLGKNDLMIDMIAEALKLSLNKKNKADIAYFASNLGNAYFAYDNYEQALINYHLALEAGKKLQNNKTISVSLNNIGNVYIRLSNYEKALDNYLQSLKIKEELDDDKNIATTLNNIANVYYRLEKFDKATKFFKKTLDIYKKVGDKAGIATSLNNLAIIYDSLKNYSKALDYHQRSKKIREEIGNGAEMSTTLNNIGNVYRNLGKYTESLKYYEQALKLKKNLNDKLGMAIVFSNLGSTHLKTGNHKDAFHNLDLGLKIAEEIESKELKKIIYKDLSDYYDATKDYKKALTFHKRYNELQQMMQNDKMSKKLAELQMNFEIEQKAKEEELNRLKNLADKYSLISSELEQRIERNLIGESTQIKEIRDQALNAAEYDDTNVLIIGESGTGKEIIARIIHFASPRKDFNFCPINCSAIPDTLLESEFFGHKKGTFTGAVKDKKGLFELANNGTLFLDEISDMPLNLQAKLLRAIEEKRIKKIGFDQELQIDARIIAATNQNINDLVVERKFRLDLYHRLNTLILTIPPLRERPEDIKPLVEHFVENFSKKMNKPKPQIKTEIYTHLQSYNFPGNVRELKNLVERALIISKHNYLDKSCFPLVDQTGKTSESSNLDIKENEEILIRTALQRTNFNQSKAARMLGISRHTLIRRIAEFNISKD